MNTERPLRICLFTGSFLPRQGGMEVVVDELARQYQRLGHEVTVLAQHQRRFSTPGRLDLPYPVRRFRRPFSQVWDVGAFKRALRRLHRRWPFDVVHCQSSYMAGYAAVRVCRPLGVPVVITTHGGDVTEESRFAHRPELMQRIRTALEQASAVTALSSYLRDRLLAFAPDCAARLHRIPNGVDCAAFAQPATSTTFPGLTREGYLLFLGRLYPRKGVDVLIAALREVRDVPLVVAGAGAELATLQQQVTKAGLGAQVRFVGFVSGADKAWLLQNALALVLPTKTWEGMPVVVLEAFACGRPVVATRVGGVTDLVRDGEHGRLVPPNDAPALAVALRELIADAGQRAAFGSGALRAAQTYDWPIVAARYVELFRSLLRHG